MDIQSIYPYKTTERK